MGRRRFGATIGAAVLLLLAQFLPVTREKTTPNTASPTTRIVDSLMVAAGAAIIIALSSWRDFAHVNWALLSFCMILAVETGSRSARARERIIGSLAGATLATVVSFVPGPVPLTVAAICVVLCIAYQLSGNYTMFVTLLTPAVLLLATSDSSLLSRGVGRIEAIIVSALIAIVCSWVAAKITTQLARRAQ